jgi:hypothetical protein
MTDVNKDIDLPYKFKSCEWNPLFPHFTASAVTPPLLSANIRSEITGSTQAQETLRKGNRLK